MSEPVANEQTVQQIAEEGVELEGCRPWRFYPLLMPNRILRAYSCGGQRDSMDWLTFSNTLTSPSSAFFESPTGYICLQNIKQGASAEVHGGAFEKRRGDQSIDQPTLALLDYLMTGYSLKVLLSFYPEHNLGAAHWDSRFGFKKMGVIPLQDFWQGEARNVIVTARVRGAKGIDRQAKLQEVIE